VETYPDVAGLGANLLFLDHREQEGAKVAKIAKGTKKGGKRANGEANAQQELPDQSKINHYEAEMCVEIVRLLWLNNYKTEQMVVLTPYLGQLLLIQRLVRQELKEVSALVDDIDRAELEKEGLLDDEDDVPDGEAETRGADATDGDNKKSMDTPPKKQLRIATVDNFQGMLPGQSYILIVVLNFSTCM
jgi:superfamily I DNA and/or RNA helicase